MFNEAIYATMEALVAGLNSGKANIEKENVTHKAAAGPEHADQRQARSLRPKPWEPMAKRPVLPSVFVTWE